MCGRNLRIAGRVGDQNSPANHVNPREWEKAFSGKRKPAP
jgi:hypothetical protein